MPRLPRPPARIATLLALACRCAIADDASTATTATTPDADPYTLSVQETATHDSNVFRAPDGVAVPAGASRSDWSSTTSLLGTIDQPFGRERLKANAQVDLDRFGGNSQLDTTTHAFNLEGDWATVGRVSGELGYLNNTQLYRYSLDSTQVLTARNVLGSEGGFARLHFGTGSRLSIDLAANALNQTYSEDLFASRDLRRHDVSAGLTWRQTPDLSFSLSDRRTIGAYPGFTQLQQVNGVSTEVVTPDHFSRNDVVLGVVYAPTGASTFKLDLATAREHHSVITARSSRVWSADGQWIWRPGGRTQVTLDFLRDDDTGSSDSTLYSANADARRRTAVSAKVDYLLTGKISLHLSGGFTHRDLDSAFADIPQLDERGSDRQVDAAFGFDYAVLRHALAGCEVSRERRTTQGALTITYPYSANVASCRLQLTFG